MGKQLTLGQWINRVQFIWDKDKKAHFYMTGASMIMPDLNVFLPAEEEKGEHIIEISFDPRTKGDDFRHLEEYGKNVFATRDRDGNDTGHKYYSNVYEPGIRQFDFLKTVVNGNFEYPFKGYFIDLLASISELSLLQITEVSEMSTARDAQIMSFDLHSPRFLK